jgi:hypothetical protein
MRLSMGSIFWGSDLTARRREQFKESVARYLAQLDTADRQEPTDVLTTKTDRLKEKTARLEGEMKRLDALEEQMLAGTCPAFQPFSLFFTALAGVKVSLFEAAI